MVIMEKNEPSRGQSVWKGSEVGVRLPCSGNKIMWVEWSKLGEE